MIAFLQYSGDMPFPIIKLGTSLHMKEVSKSEIQKPNVTWFPPLQFANVVRKHRIILKPFLPFTTL